MSRVVLAMSGGVDSSVAAHLLQEAGHEVIGVFMRHGEEPAAQCAGSTGPTGTLPILDTRSDHKQGCCSAADAHDARRVADRLDIPFYALDLQADFRRIIDYFVDQYVHGRTPNPCVVCNHWLKFGKLFEYADSVDAQYVATGHYARCTTGADGTRGLFRGRDAEKDQSYVLFGIDRRRLRRMLLPVGPYRKEDIRRLAASLGLRVADKRDSQEICFITSGHHAQFVRDRRRDRDTAGRIVTTDGQIVGYHDGIERFTVGQRKGLGVAMGSRYFVLRIEPRSRNVVIGRREQLARRTLTADQTNWLTDPPSGSVRCWVQIRYNTRPTAGCVRVLGERRLEVVFDEPCLGVAPGQAVVCYDEDRVLGGGWIESESESDQVGR